MNMSENSLKRNLLSSFSFHKANKNVLREIAKLKTNLPNKQKNVIIDKDIVKKNLNQDEKKSNILEENLFPIEFDLHGGESEKTFMKPCIDSKVNLDNAKILESFANIWEDEIRSRENKNDINCPTEFDNVEIKCKQEYFEKENNLEPCNIIDSGKEVFEVNVTSKNFKLKNCGSSSPIGNALPVLNALEKDFNIVDDKNNENVSFMKSPLKQELDSDNIEMSEIPESRNDNNSLNPANEVFTTTLSIPRKNNKILVEKSKSSKSKSSLDGTSKINESNLNNNKIIGIKEKYYYKSQNACSDQWIKTEYICPNSNIKISYLINANQYSAINEVENLKEVDCANKKNCPSDLRNNNSAHRNISKINKHTKQPGNFEKAPNQVPCVSNKFEPIKNIEHPSKITLQDTDNFVNIPTSDTDKQNELDLSKDNIDNYKLSGLSQINISQCLRGWKVKYPWVEFQEEKSILICNKCSAQSSSFIVCEIKDFDDVYKVAANLLKHSIIERHVLLSFINHGDNLNKVFTLLKCSLHKNISKDMLINNIGDIITNSIGTSKIRESIIYLLIRAITMVINEHVLNILRSCNISVISYIIDPCRKILIAKHCINHYPEDLVVTDYMFSSLTQSISEYVVKSDLFSNKATFLRDMFCTKCSKCNYSQICDRSLPPMYPSIHTLYQYILQNEYFQVYSQFIYQLSNLIKENYQAFSSVHRINIFFRSNWQNLRLYIFLARNFSRIKSILTKLNKPLKFDYEKIYIKNIFYHFISLVSIISDFYSAPTFDRVAFRSAVSEDIQNIFNKLKSDKFISPFYETYSIIYLFIEEINCDGYYIGRQNENDLYLYFEPRRLACIEDAGAPGHDIKAVIAAYNVFSRFINISYQRFKHSLSSFGKFLLKNAKEEQYVKLFDILDMFRKSPTIKSKFLNVFKFYEMLATLPCTPTASQRSFFEVQTLRSQLFVKFSSDLAHLLFPIVQEGSLLSEIPRSRIKDKIITLTA